MARVTTYTCDRCERDVVAEELEDVSIEVSVCGIVSHEECELCGACRIEIGAGEDAQSLQVAKLCMLAILGRES